MTSSSCEFSSKLPLNKKEMLKFRTNQTQLKVERALDREILPDFRRLTNFKQCRPVIGQVCIRYSDLDWLKTVTYTCCPKSYTTQNFAKEYAITKTVTLVISGVTLDVDREIGPPKLWSGGDTTSKLCNRLMNCR